MTQTMTPSKVPIFDARPRADNSAVARCSDASLEQTAAAVARFNVVDLEPASLRENVVREREKLNRARISSRRNGARSACSTRLSKRARKLHQTEAKPADSEVKSQVSNKQRKEKTEIRIQQKDRSAQFKSVGTAARVQCKRQSHEHM